MEYGFQTYRFPMGTVLPPLSEAAAYMHLDAEGDPQAYRILADEWHLIREEAPDCVGGYALFDVEAMDVRAGWVRLNGTEILPQPQVCGYLRDSQQAALFVCTAGAIFSDRVKQHNEKEEYLEAYYADALGSLTVERAMDLIQADLERRAEAEGSHISNRYSPGYCNWPLLEQRKLFALLQGNPTGVSLTESCLMQPIKSVSGVIGVGPAVKKRPYGCAVCRNKTCIYRKLIAKE